MNIGETIKHRRKELNMSVDELAKAIGKDRSTVYRYESGNVKNIPMELLLPIAEALKTSPKQLMIPPQKWGIDFDTKRKLGGRIETSNEWLSDRAERWFDATDGFEFSVDELAIFYELAKYFISIQNYEDYEERITFLNMLFKQLNQ